MPRLSCRVPSPLQLPVCIVAPGVRARLRPGVSDEADQDHRAVRAPAVRPTSTRASSAQRSAGGARAAVRRRRPSGRGLDHRHRCGREERARRLHAAADVEHADRQRVADSRTSRYQLMRDFVPVAPINYSDLVLVVHPSVRRQQRRRAHRASRRRARASSTTRRPVPGTPYHMAGELFKAMAGVDIVHVPYKGSSGARTDVLGGQVQMMFDAVHDDERAREGGPRAARSARRARRARRCFPTCRRSTKAGVAGLRGGDLARHHGAEGHAAARSSSGCNAEITKIQNRPEVRQEWASQGAVPMAMTPGRVRPLSRRRHRQVGAHREDLRSEGRPVSEVAVRRWRCILLSARRSAGHRRGRSRRTSASPPRDRRRQRSAPSGAMREKLIGGAPCDASF